MIDANRICGMLRYPRDTAKIKYLLFFLVFLFGSSCQEEPPLVLNEIRELNVVGDLRLANSPILASTAKNPLPNSADSLCELSLNDFNATGILDPITARHGLKTARAQARIWDEEAELVHVWQRDCSITPLRNAPPIENTLTWVYMFKAKMKPSDWLAVLVGSIGVIDVGKGRLNREPLRELLPIDSWKVKCTTLKGPSFSSGAWHLIAVLLNEDTTVVWISPRYATPVSSGSPQRIVYDAVTGKEIRSDAESIAYEVWARKFLWTEIGR